MLKNVLSHNTCANCRICCSFVKADAWESPIFSEDEMKQILALGVDEKKFKKNAEDKKITYVADYHFENDTQILLCPCLDEEKGCILGENKPFECSIWPVRIFRDKEGLSLKLAKACPAFAGEKQDSLVKELREHGLAEKILSNWKKQTRIKEDSEDYISLK